MPTTARNTATVPLGLWKLFALIRDDTDTHEAANHRAIETLPHAERIVEMLREGYEHEDLNEELQRAMETAYPADMRLDEDLGYPLRSAFFVGIATAWLLTNGDRPGA